MKTSTAPSSQSTLPLPVAEQSTGSGGAFLAFAGRAITNQWRLFILPLLFGAAVGVVLALSLGKFKWEPSGVMLYTPLPITDSQKGLYQQPDQATLLALLKSPEVLGALRNELELDVPLRVLERSFVVTAPRNVQVVTITASWSEPELAVRMVNLLMDRYIDRLRAYRRTRSGAVLADYEARLADCDARHAKATQAAHIFFRQHSLVDSKFEVELVRHDLESYQTARLAATRSERTLLAQRERLSKELEASMKSELAEAEKSREFNASTESVADNRRRQDRLRELIAEETQRQQWAAELAAKRKEYDQRIELRNKGVGAQSAVDEAARDIEILTSKLTDNEKVKAWKEELDKIDKVVVPKGKSPSVGSPIIHQLLMKQLELDLQYVGIQKDLSEANHNLATARKQQETLQNLIRESEGLTKAIDEVAAERQQLTEQIGLFRRLRDQAACEFAIVSPATKPPFPTSSTRKLWFVASLPLGGLLGFARACRNQRRLEYHGGREAANRAQVDVLGVFTSQLDSSRALATAVRSWQPEYGTTLLVTHGLGATTWDVIRPLGERLSARDERVLIVDCRVGTTPMDAAPGLADYLGMRVCDWESLLIAGHGPGVDILPAGSEGDIDSLATQLVSELVSTARQRYSMVFLLCPELDDRTTLQILAPYATGIVICLGRTRQPGLIQKNLEAVARDVLVPTRAVLVTPNVPPA